MCTGFETVPWVLDSRIATASESHVDKGVYFAYSRVTF
jgi:hypothetical protein